MKTILLIILLTIGCGSEKKSDPKSEMKEGWSDVKINVASDGCTETLYSTKASERVTLQRSRSFCKCLITSISEKFSVDDFINFPDEAVKELKRDGVYKSCADSSGLDWNEVDGVYLTEF